MSELKPCPVCETIVGDEANQEAILATYRAALVEVARMAAMHAIGEQTTLRLAGLTMADIGVGVLADRIVSEHLAEQEKP